MVKILLDPGHGGGRAYNRGFKQVESLPYCNEGDCNYIYAKDYLKPALERYGFQVGMTKSNITPDIPLQKRGAMGRGYDLLISCHSNACGGNVRGVEIWDSTNPKESIKSLTDKLCNAISATLGIPNRGTKYRRNKKGSNYYGILRNGMAKHNFIVEHAFHDNLSDATIYRKNLQPLAEAMARAVAEYYGLAKPSKPLPDSHLKDTSDDFIILLLKGIKGKKLNILPSVTIAQAILESNWGKSELAKKANNLFGIKASKDWNGKVYNKETKEQKSTGEVYTIKADFRAYDSVIDSIVDHDAFFVSTDWRKNNYKRVLEATNYKDQAYAMKDCGYATDLNYGKKLIELIERLGLQQYDRGVEQYVTKDINKVSNWAKEELEEAIKLGITDGTSPGQTATREEVAAMNLRVYKKLKEEIDELKAAKSEKKCDCSNFKTGL